MYGKPIQLPRRDIVAQMDMDKDSTDSYTEMNAELRFLYLNSIRVES